MVLAASVSAADPPDRRAWHCCAVGGGDHARQSALHVLLQCVVGSQFGRLRAPSAPLGVPLRARSPIVQVAGSRPGFRRSSREIVEGDRFVRREISRIVQPRA